LYAAISSEAVVCIGKVGGVRSSCVCSEADVVCISSISRMSTEAVLNVSAGTSGGDADKRVFSAATRHFSACLRTYEAHALKERDAQRILSYSAFPRIRNKRDLQGSEQAIENRV